MASKSTIEQNLEKRKSLFGASRSYYANNKEIKCAKKRERYAFHEPKLNTIDMYLKEIEANLLDSSKTQLPLIKLLKKQHKTLAEQACRVLGKTACRLAGKWLLNKVCKCARNMVGLW